MTSELHPVVRVIDDEESVRNSETFIFRVAGIDSRAYAGAAEFLERDDLERPGCIVCDVRMPGMSGLELQQELLRRGVDLPLLFLTGHGDINMAVMAMKRGAADFLEKPADPARLKRLVLELMVRSCEKRKRLDETESMKRLWDTLTPREKEVMRLVAEGTLNKIIADRLGVTEQTVKIHRGSGNRKLGIRTAVEANNFLRRMEGEADHGV